jgi:hypothetical protein
LIIVLPRIGFDEVSALSIREGAERFRKASPNNIW